MESRSSSSVPAGPGGESGGDVEPWSAPGIGDRPLGWWASLGAALRGAELDYTRSSLPRAISLLAVPMVLEFSMESVFAIVDVWFVSQLDDPSAIAVIGLTEGLLTLVFALAIGLSMAATALVARRVGEGNLESARRAGMQAIVLALACGVATGVPACFFGADLLELMGAGPDAIAVGSSYTSILLGTNVVIMLLFIGNAVFRGAGDAFIAMKTLWIANCINIVLDPCLIHGWGPFPAMGVTGAAAATAVGRGTGAAFLLYSLWRGRSRVSLRGRSLRLDLPVLRELVRLSRGGVAQFLIATASWVVVLRLVAPFGEDAVAGATIAVRIVMFALLPSWGLSNAAPTLVGQSLGAGLPDRAARAVWLTGAYNMAFLAIVTAVFLTWGPVFVGLFSEEAAIVEHGADALRVLSYGYICYAWGMVLVQSFNGAGDTMTPTWINFFCLWCLELPLAWLLAHHVGLGPSGAFWAVAIAETVLAVVAFIVFRRGRWKSVAIPAEAEDGAPVGASLEPLPGGPESDVDSSG